MDITKLPLLATLEVLLRERSVRETARLLGVSPSTVSRHLAQLRELVGDPLFVRSGNLMLPTDRARDLSVQLTPRLREPSPKPPPPERGGFSAASLTLMVRPSRT